MREDITSGDEVLMERFRDGESGAFDVLYGRHKGGLFRYMLRQCGNRGVAEELFQDVWMNLIRARAAYTVQAKFTTYLYRLAHNRLIDHYRSQAGGMPASFDAADGPVLDNIEAGRNSDPAIGADNRQQAARLLQLIGELPEAQREAFLLQQESDMSVEEIAKATGVSRETAKSRLRYAINKLRLGMGAV
ncbi:MAG TPA: sigma-70 family RNA polymerase sigma factor [Burkholderiales bacterium]|jgi:RNA polymerase sigma-70 factor (ECF subfamily)|nr:sigma-70 family RNA polymerase sigma factor [Burkholderiales bacterium]